MANQNSKFCKSLKQPDEVRRFKAHGELGLVSFEDGTSIGKGRFEPGWKWSNDVQPLAETKSCEAAHHGYCLSGSMIIKMDSCEQFKISEGHAFEIPPGHDAWVEGNAPCVLLDFGGYSQYAKKAAA